MHSRLLREYVVAFLRLTMGASDREARATWLRMPPQNGAPLDDTREDARKVYATYFGA